MALQATEGVQGAPGEMAVVRAAVATVAAREPPQAGTAARGAVERAVAVTEVAAGMAAGMAVMGVPGRKP